jgi:sugar O-acyltransferase (sialic acid O-acetyltransferase NeuD family)
MSLPPLLLVGAGGHARACIDVIEAAEVFKIAGLVGKAEEIGAVHAGYPVIATDAELPKLVSSCHYALIVVGQLLSPDARIRLYRQLRMLGYELPSIISPLAYVSRHATLGPGTIVMHGSVVNAGATVGANCIVNTSAVIEHDVMVGDHCHISTGVILNGGVCVGKGSFVGSRCVVREGVVLGQRCVVGVGLSVRHNLSDRTRFTGGNE